MSKVHLLLVEDDEDDYIITRDLLREIDPDMYSLDWATTIDEAKSKLQLDQHHVCLMDYRLGPEDGVELLKQAGELGFKAPIIMLTGQDDDRLDTEAQAAGAVDYLVKSNLTASRLARAIRYAISRREMETERVERLRAESENQAKSEFLAHLSHELRTPLTAILGYTDVLLRQVSKNQEKNNLNIIKRNGHHLLSLLNDVLDLSKIEAGKLDIEEREFELQPFIDDIFYLMRVNANDKGLAFVVSADTQVPSVITSDPTRLRQILLNLIGNAIKFTDTGQVSLTISARPSSAHNDQITLSFAIKDTGIGIAQKSLKELFKPFSQLHAQSPQRSGGTGLGLAISSQLAEKLGGNISVTSLKGVGSEFVVTLLNKIPETHVWTDFELSDVQEKQAPAQAPSLMGKILIADDVEEIRYLVGNIIEQTGAEVDYAVDGLDALDKFNTATEQPYDLVILDMQMPRMTGSETLLALRKQGAKQPVIALTAATMKDQRDESIRMGFNDHLSKPIDQKQLWQCVAKYLNQGEDSSEVKSSLLLVEDDDDARSATTMLLELMDVRVDAVASVNEALELLKHNIYDAILSDLNLPGLSGFALAETVRSLANKPKYMIALSGESIDPEKLQKSGFDQAYLKPINLEKLETILKAIRI